MSAMIEIEIVGEAKTSWGEGAIWHNGVLYYVDIEGHKVHRFDPSSGLERSWDVGQRVGTVVPRSQGGLLCAGDNGFFFLNEETGEIQAISDPEPDMPNNRFNDGKCSPDGKLFAGTISLVKKEGDAKLYRLDPDLSVHEAYSPVTNSNGIAWALDGKTLYYIDTPTKEVKAFDYSEGILSNQRRVISTSHYKDSPDGMTVDAEGNLWIAFCHGACVCCFNPNSGEEICKVDLPCLETTACAWGGDDLGDLYVTTGVHKSVEEEFGGRLLRVRGLGVKGVVSQVFQG